MQSRNPAEAALPWRPVLSSWVAARVAVLAMLAVATVIGLLTPVHSETLLGWDADWYRRIADVGYGGLPPESVRFFPLLPMLVAPLSWLLLGSQSVALLLVANTAAVAYALLLHRVALCEGLSRAVADRVPWVLAFAPAGQVLVMGYTEPLFGVLACVAFLGARDRRWWPAAAAGLLAGALRPTGVVLALPVLVEACRGLRTVPRGELAARVAACAAPATGLGAYLGWCGWRYGDALRPFSVQVTSRLRGGTFVDPLPGIGRALDGAVHLRLAGAGVHVLWAGLALALLVVVARRLPASYTAFTAATLLLGLTARQMTSFERYASSAFPLLLVVASLMPGPPRVRVIMGAAAAVLCAYALLTFLHRYVP
jgi:hypothetical protein